MYHQGETSRLGSLLRLGLLVALIGLGVHVVKARATLFLAGKPAMFTMTDLSKALKASEPMPSDESSPASPAPRLVVADFSAPWCASCKGMDQRTWTDPRIVQWVDRSAIAVYVNTDDHSALVAQYGVESVPTTIIFRDGREIGRRVGRTEPTEMIEWLEQLAGL